MEDLKCSGSGAGLVSFVIAAREVVGQDVWPTVGASGIVQPGRTSAFFLRAVGVVDLGQGVVAVAGPVQVEVLLQAGVEGVLGFPAVPEFHVGAGSFEAEGVGGEVGGAALFHLKTTA